MSSPRRRRRSWAGSRSCTAGKEGLGSAYRAGFARALSMGADRIVQMDADFSHDPSVVPLLLAAVEAGADVAIGSRYVTGGSTENWPLHRRVLSRLGNRYTAGVLRLPIRDVTAGFRCYRAEVLRGIDPASTSAEGYAFLTELARRAVRSGCSVAEVPICFADRTVGESKMSGRIIRESMWLVTTWGGRDLLDALRRRGTR
ncbi:MAG: glycosyltransferase [Ilumatobacteraceae bacterium]